MLFTWTVAWPSTACLRILPIKWVRKGLDTWTTAWVKNSLDCGVHRAVSSSKKTQLVIGYQQCLLRANTKAYNAQYINDLDDGMDCTPTKFIDNSQVVRETVDRPEGRATSQNGPSEAGEKN